MSPRSWSASPLPAVLLVAVALGVRPAEAALPVGATITAVEGQAEVVPPGGSAALPARLNMRVVAGSTVRTGSAGRAELLFDDRSLLRLDHDTEIQVLGGPGERGVLVTLGKLWAHVQQALGVSKFRVKTPTVVAGVRGTILRAEVTEEEATIAVDDGEVELTAPGDAKPVILRSNTLCRARRGARRGAPQAFDPGAREKWEFWTDPLVQRDLRSIEESASAVKTAAEEVKQQALSIFENLATDSAAVKRVGQQMLVLDGTVQSVAVALGLETGPAARGPRRAPPPKPVLLARLNAAEKGYQDLAPLVERGRRSLQDHVRDVGGLREKLADHRKAEEELATRLRELRSAREVDPHWALFRPHLDRCEAQRLGLGRALTSCSPLLSPQLPPKLGDDPRLMLSIQARFHWAFQALNRHQQQIPQRQQAIDRLRALLNR